MTIKKISNKRIFYMVYFLETSKFPKIDIENIGSRFTYLHAFFSINSNL